MTAPVLATQAWRTNAELIADVARLGYLVDVPTLDPTYGAGTWWRLWRPSVLVGLVRDVDGHDFRHMDMPTASWPQIAFDPPYVARGGRQADTALGSLNERFGLVDAPKNPPELQRLIDHGLSEMHRLLAPGGTLLVKCADYVTAGKVWWGTDRTNEHAQKLGLRKIDRFDLITNPRPQPPRTRSDGKPTRQQHARRNTSTLFVYRKPKR